MSKCKFCVQSEAHYCMLIVVFFFWKTVEFVYCSETLVSKIKVFIIFVYVPMCICVCLRGVHLCVCFRMYVCARMYVCFRIMYVCVCMCACVHMKFLIFSLIRKFSVIIFLSRVLFFYWYILVYFFFFSIFNHISSAFYTVLKIPFFQIVFSFDVAAEQSRFLSSLKTPKRYSLSNSKSTQKM